MKPENNQLYQQLLDNVSKLGSLVAGFSGGVDSSLLVYAAHQALGDRMIAVTVKTPYVPQWELEESRAFTEQYSITHEIIELPVPAEILHNPPDRCYLCKKKLFGEILKFMNSRGIATLIEGSNVDDLEDYRPGMKALEELKIVSPLLQCRITKQQIRDISRELGLKVWNKPSNACLLSRLPYHTRITEAELKRIALAEQVLRDLQISGSRVRSHGDIARVEMPAKQLAEFMSTNDRFLLTEKLKSCGYRYVTLDLEGYQMGSMNKTI